MSTRKKRGAQPGNRNALKHGFYARQFEDEELSDLEILQQGVSLNDEILMLRIVTRRLLEMSNRCEDIEQLSGVLNTLGLAATRLGTLVRLRKQVGEDNELSAAINQVLAEMAQDLSL